MTRKFLSSSPGLQLKVRFREYFVYLLMKEKSFKKINHLEDAENIDLHVNNSQKLLTN